LHPSLKIFDSQHNISGGVRYKGKFSVVNHKLVYA
jgi:hypothetical protein